jgi:hypothetical protein
MCLCHRGRNIVIAIKGLRNLICVQVAVSWVVTPCCLVGGTDVSEGHCV